MRLAMSKQPPQPQCLGLGSSLSTQMTWDGTRTSTLTPTHASTSLSILPIYTYVCTYPCAYVSVLHCRYVTSWIDKREVQSEKANLTILFDRYVPPCLDSLRRGFKKITPVSEQSMIQTLCYLLETLLTPANTPPDCPKEWYELYFVFAAVWAFGGSMYEDQVCVGEGREEG